MSCNRSPVEWESGGENDDVELGSRRAEREHVKQPHSVPNIGAAHGSCEIKCTAERGSA